MTPGLPWSPPFAGRPTPPPPRRWHPEMGPEYRLLSWLEVVDRYMRVRELIAAARDVPGAREQARPALNLRTAGDRELTARIAGENDELVVIEFRGQIIDVIEEGA